MPAPKTLEQAFWPKVDRRGPDECWPWTGAKNHKNYGSLLFEIDGLKQHHRATQISWRLRHGRPFPAGLFACHTCDNPICVNPAHIWPGTYEQNMADANAKGRFRYAPCPHPRIPENMFTRIHAGKPETGCRLCRNDRARARTMTIDRLFREITRLPADKRRELDARLAESAPA